MDDEMLERAMDVGWSMSELFDTCDVCGDFIYKDTCACTIEQKIPSRVRFTDDSSYERQPRQQRRDRKTIRKDWGD